MRGRESQFATKDMKTRRAGLGQPDAPGTIGRRHPFLGCDEPPEVIPANFREVFLGFTEEGCKFFLPAEQVACRQKGSEPLAIQSVKLLAHHTMEARQHFLPTMGMGKHMNARQYAASGSEQTLLERTQHL